MSLPSPVNYVIGKKEDFEILTLFFNYFFDVTVYFLFVNSFIDTVVRLTNLHLFFNINCIIDVFKILESTFDSHISSLDQIGCFLRVPNH